MRPHSLGPSTTKVRTLAMESGNIINLQDFEQNEVPFKQRSFEDSIDTFFSLFDADLLLIWMNKFRDGFRFRIASCPVLHIVLIISRGECTCRGKCGMRLFCHTTFLTKNIIKSKYQDQFSCYPYKLSKRNTHSWLVSFSSFKMQPTRFHYGI